MRDKTHVPLWPLQDGEVDFYEFLACLMDWSKVGLLACAGWLVAAVVHFRAFDSASGWAWRLQCNCMRVAGCL